MRGYADEALMQIAEAQHAGRQSSGNEKLFVTFEMHPVRDEVKTAEAGHPVFEDVPFIRKVVPGDTLHFEVQLLEPIRRGVAVVEGKAFVGETLACEATMMAQIVKNKE